MRKQVRPKWMGMRFSASCLMGVLLGAPLGCGVDDQFSVETDDEYSEPLTNAVIGTPESVITISPTGEAKTVPAPTAGAGSGGSTASGGAGGASSGGTPASAGKGGSGGNAGKGASGGGTVTAGSPGATGAAGSPDPGGGGGFGQWHFDDCSPSNHFLLDSSGLGAHAQQALKAACVPGISGLGVMFRSKKDVVQVPAQPQFTIEQHVGVAAWVNPKNVSGDQPIVIKRENNKTAFSLGIHKGNIEMSVVLENGKTIISRAPIEANKWTHVAGMFVGTFVFLFINGQQFGQVFGAGTVRDVFAPIRIGATTQSQFFNGAIDDVFVTTDTISSNVLTSLSCISKPSTLSVTPPTSGLVPPDTTVIYDVSVTNNDVGRCEGKRYDMFFGGVDRGFSASVDGNSQFVLPGEQAKFSPALTASDEAEVGVHNIPFFVQSFNPVKFDVEQLTSQLTYEVAEPTGCFVRSRRELMITDVSVVDDPVRAAGSFDPTGGFPFPGGTGGSGAAGSSGFAGFPGSTGGPGFPGSTGSTGGVRPVGTGATSGIGGAPGATGAPSPVKGGSGPIGAGGTGVAGSTGGGGPITPTPQTAGVWSFGHLMREMAPTPEAAPDMTLKLLQHWLSDQTVNGFTVQARPAMQNQLIDIWPKTPSGELDLDQSPLTLQAIVNRIDVRNLAEGSAGEGRLVYGVNGFGNFRNFTVIVEYNLVGHTQADVNDWANRWHALGSLPFPSEQYNAALEAITRRFTDRGASPGSPNGSALVELRTNEIALSFQWELRAFVISPTNGLFAETTVKETPDASFNDTTTFATVVNQNAAAIIAEVPGADAHTIPVQFGGSPFMAGSIFNNQIPWNGPGITDPEARFHASINTCNGCHGPETGTFNFLMITPRNRGTEAELSPFITGTQSFDPFTGQTRQLNDLGRRKTDLTALVCDSTPTPIPPPIKK